MTNLTFKELIQKTNQIIDAFKKVEQKEWGIEGNMIELMKQVGELSKNVMMLEKYYLAHRDNDPKYNTASKEAIANELSDILFMIIRIANHYSIDLETAHLKELALAMESLENKS
ncbi:MAG: hypothetical protein ACOZAJ_01225 [Patescibacteria group bacterium]